MFPVFLLTFKGPNSLSWKKPPRFLLWSKRSRSWWSVARSDTSGPAWRFLLPSRWSSIAADRFPGGTPFCFPRFIGRSSDLCIFWRLIALIANWKCFLLTLPLLPLYVSYDWFVPLVRWYDIFLTWQVLLMKPCLFLSCSTTLPETFLPLEFIWEMSSILKKKNICDLYCL